MKMMLLMCVCMKIIYTVCFIQKESSGGEQISKTCELLLCLKRFEIYQPPEDSIWIKQTAEAFCTIIHFSLSICHSAPFCISQTKANTFVCVFPFPFKLQILPL